MESSISYLLQKFVVNNIKKNFVNMLPNLSCTNFVEEKDNYTAHCAFSTYQTMMNCIDEVKDNEVKLFTCGHFDLVICDEAHRSIYNKYRDIFADLSLWQGIRQAIEKVNKDAAA